MLLWLGSLIHAAAFANLHYPSHCGYLDRTWSAARTLPGSPQPSGAAGVLGEHPLPPAGPLSRLRDSS